MAYSLENTTDLTNLADAIRAKTGGNSSMTVAEMATEVSTISSGEQIDSRIFQMPEDVSSLFSNNKWFYFLQQYKDRIIFPNSGVYGTSLFDNSTLITNELGSLSIKMMTNGGTVNSWFNNCQNLTELPILSGEVYRNFNSFFAGCRQLQRIPDAKVANLNFGTNFNNYNGSTGASNIFNGCYSLRYIPSHLLTHCYTAGTSANSGGYNGVFRSCLFLDEIDGLHVSSTTTKTVNMFSYTFNECYRLKKITFITDNGIPYSRTWSNQVIDLSTYVGYCPFTISNWYNSGITADKKVTDATSYANLKNDPDWYTEDIAYSRYNHDSAVETINSLPNCSSGSNNVIKFLGASGSATDGGAINTLTSAEIAVATNKGWTVTLV